MLAIIVFSVIFVVGALSDDTDTILDKPVWSSVKVPLRINNILIVVTKNCTVEAFETLFKAINSLERNKTCEEDECFKWTTNYSFGGKVNITNENGTTININTSVLLGYSQVDDVQVVTTQYIQSLAPCPSEAVREFIIIISDTCLIDQLKTVNYNATDNCSKIYRRSLLIIPSNNDDLDCSSTDHVFVFLATNIHDSELQIYNDLFIQYYSTPITSKVNFFAIVHENKLPLIWEYLERKGLDNPECQGLFLGLFQTIDSKNIQRISVMALPLHFGHGIDNAKIFVNNIQRLYANDTQQAFNNNTKCAPVNGYFQDALSQNHDFEQYNILFLDLEHACVNFTWNMTKRHFDLYVLDQASHASNFMNFVDGDSTKLNHIRFQDSTNNDTLKNLQKDTVCNPRGFPQNFTFETLSQLTTTEAYITDGPSNSPTSTLTTIRTSSLHESTRTYESPSPIDFDTTESFQTSTTPLFTALDSTHALRTTSISSTSSSFKSTTLTNSKGADPSKIVWYILPGILCIIIICLVIIVIKWRRIRKKRKFLFYLTSAQEKIKAEFEASPVETQLSHDKRLNVQLNAKNVLIDFNTIIGKGSNATVYKAIIQGKSKYYALQKSFKSSVYDNCQAAFKLSTTFDVDEIETFVRELDALITLGPHPHIIALLGWSLYNETPALITELAASNLLTYVKSFRGSQLPYKSILSILWQISQALDHLAKLSLVHRDVACRNILLTEALEAKLADFGLCCHCDESFMYKASLFKKFPLKWLSIEALVDRIFSEKSDVWAFGILCYEIFTFGAVPYSAMTNLEMLKFLQFGQRLEKPEVASEAIYKLMLECWKTEPSERPTFNELEKLLRMMLEEETEKYGYLTLSLEDNN